MNVEAILLLFRKIFQGNGVVEILRVFSVDGNGRKAAQISPALGLHGFLRDRLRNPLRLRFHFIRKSFRQGKCANHGENVYSGIRHCAENLRNSAEGIREKGRVCVMGNGRASSSCLLFLLAAVGQNLGYDFVPGNGSFCFSRMDIEGRGQLYIVREEEKTLFPCFYKTQHFLYGVLHHLYDSSFRFLIAFFFLHNLNLNRVTVHGSRFRTARNKDVFQLLFRKTDKTEAFLRTGINPF